MRKNGSMKIFFVFFYVCGRCVRITFLHPQTTKKFMFNQIAEQTRN